MVSVESKAVVDILSCATRSFDDRNFVEWQKILSDKYDEVELDMDSLDILKYSEIINSQYYSLLDNTNLKKDLAACNTPEMVSSTIEGESCIVVIHGDIHIHGHLIIDKLFSCLYEKNSSKPIIIFTGKLQVEGAIVVEETEYDSSGVVFAHDVQCHDLCSSGLSLIFLQQLNIKRLYMHKNQGEGLCVTNEELFAPIQIKYNYCSVWNSDRTQVFGFADPCEVPEVALNTTFKAIRDYFVYDEDEELYYFDEEKVDMTFEDYILQVALADPNRFTLEN